MSNTDHHESQASQPVVTAHDITTNSTQEDSNTSTTPHTTQSEHTTGVSGIAQDRVEQQTGTSTESEEQFVRAGPVRTDTTTALMQAQAQAPPSPPPPMPRNSITRTVSTAIGPSVDQPPLPAKDEEETGPTLQITLLLTNGARHPFKLDSRYLAKRNVEAQDSDPFNLSVYKLKELILREWREEWELKPTSPSYIRLISFGRLLDDKALLKGKSAYTSS